MCACGQRYIVDSKSAGGKDKHLLQHLVRFPFFAVNASAPMLDAHGSDGAHGDAGHASEHSGDGDGDATKPAHDHGAHGLHGDGGDGKALICIGVPVTARSSDGRQIYDSVSELPLFQVLLRTARENSHVDLQNPRFEYAVLMGYDEGDAMFDSEEALARVRRQFMNDMGEHDWHLLVRGCDRTHPPLTHLWADVQVRPRVPWRTGLDLVGALRSQRRGRLRLLLPAQRRYRAAHRRLGERLCQRVAEQPGAAYVQVSERGLCD